MKALLLALFLSAPASAQTLPQEIADVPISENFKYVDQQLRGLANEVTTVNVTLGPGGVLTFPDGTTQTTAAGATAAVSSFTNIPADTAVTQTVCNVAVATVTLTVAAAPLEIELSGTAISGNENWAVGFLVDGTSPVGPLNKIVWNITNTIGDDASVSFTRTIPALSAGSHSFALVACSAASSVTFCPTNYTFQDASCRFGVKELH